MANKYYLKRSSDSKVIKTINNKKPISFNNKQIFNVPDKSSNKNK